MTYNILMSFDLWLYICDSTQECMVDEDCGDLKYCLYEIENSKCLPCIPTDMVRIQPVLAFVINCWVKAAPIKWLYKMWKLLVLVTRLQGITFLWSASLQVYGPF